MGETVSAAGGLAPTLTASVNAEALRALGVVGVAIFLMSADRKTLELVRQRGLPEGLRRAATIQVGAPRHIGRAAERGTVEADAEEHVVAVPMSVGHDRVGVLLLVFAAAWVPSGAEQTALRVLGNVLGLSMQLAKGLDFRAAIDAQRAQLQIVLDSAPHAILFIEAGSGDVVANPRAMQLLGDAVPPSAGWRQYLGQIRCPGGERLAEEELPCSAALAGRVIADKELLIIRADGRLRFC